MIWWSTFLISERSELKPHQRSSVGGWGGGGSVAARLCTQLAVSVCLMELLQWNRGIQPWCFVWPILHFCGSPVCLYHKVSLELFSKYCSVFWTTTCSLPTARRTRSNSVLDNVWSSPQQQWVGKIRPARCQSFAGTNNRLPLKLFILRDNYIEIMYKLYKKVLIVPSWLLLKGQ